MSLMDTVTENIGLKTLALFLALLLWFSVTVRQEGEVSMVAAVQLKNIPSHLSVASPPPPSILVEIAGPKILIMKLRKTSLAAVLDLKGYGAGTFSFPRLDTTVRLPDGLRVMRVDPSSIELKLVEKK